MQGESGPRAATACKRVPSGILAVAVRAGSLRSNPVRAPLALFLLPDRHRAERSDSTGPLRRSVPRSSLAECATSLTIGVVRASRSADSPAEPLDSVMDMRRKLLPLLVLPTLLIAGCSSGASQACETLQENGAGARIFSSYVAWGAGPADADSRLAVMDSVEEPPADLVDEWDTWHTHLTAIREAEIAGGAPPELISDGASGDAAAAGSALSDYYIETCL